jgi:chondroitin 4-sulfotransferase 11|tara:strand:+ start:2153 stop:2821 length:669 start_codon:yes stop_codon:yes gene_type:complete
MGWFFHHKKYKMENKYTDYLRLKRDYNYDILRSICVNPTSKLIYFKPGKSAGTSIFRRNLQPKGGWIIQKDNPKEFNNWLQNITDKELNSYFKFIFVRNPFSRLISAWNDIDKPYFPDFGKFVQEGIFDKNGNPKTLHYQLQSSLFKTLDNYSLNLDFIGKIENIKDDWKTLCNLTNLPYQELGHYANRNHNHYTTYYTDEIREIVSNWYRRDLEFFNYNFK